MLMKQNVNNDVTKDSPVARAVRFRLRSSYFYFLCSLCRDCPNKKVLAKGHQFAFGNRTSYEL